MGDQKQNQNLSKNVEIERRWWTTFLVILKLEIFRFLCHKLTVIIDRRGASDKTNYNIYSKKHKNKNACRHRYCGNFHNYSWLYLFFVSFFFFLKNYLVTRKPETECETKNKKERNENKTRKKNWTLLFAWPNTSLRWLVMVIIMEIENFVWSWYLFHSHLINVNLLYMLSLCTIFRRENNFHFQLQNKTKSKNNLWFSCCWFYFKIFV